MGYEVVKPDGAFYLFVKALEKDANAFSEVAKKFELLLVPSDSFGYGGYVRISYCVSTKQIEASIPAFKRLIEYYKKISLKELLLYGLAYMVDHPGRKSSSQVKEDKSIANNGYAVVRGLDPLAKGEKIGDILCFVKDSHIKNSVEKIALVKVDGKTVLPGIWYGIDLSERKGFL